MNRVQGFVIYFSYILVHICDAQQCCCDLRKIYLRELWRWRRNVHDRTHCELRCAGFGDFLQYCLLFTSRELRSAVDTAWDVLACSRVEISGKRKCFYIKIIFKFCFLSEVNLILINFIKTTSGTDNLLYFLS